MNPYTYTRSWPKLMDNFLNLGLDYNKTTHTSRFQLRSRVFNAFYKHVSSTCDNSSLDPNGIGMLALELLISGDDVDLKNIKGLGKKSIEVIETARNNFEILSEKARLDVLRVRPWTDRPFNRYYDYRNYFSNLEDGKMPYASEATRFQKALNGVKKALEDNGFQLEFPLTVTDKQTNRKWF